MWIVTAVCLIGTVMNVKRLRACFLFWAVGNILWLAVDIKAGTYSRAMLDTVQLGFSLWGLYEWREQHGTKGDNIQKN
jgi:Nicotinamide mononucleotide transporter.